MFCGREFCIVFTSFLYFGLLAFFLFFGVNWVFFFFFFALWVVRVVPHPFYAHGRCVCVLLSSFCHLCSLLLFFFCFWRQQVFLWCVIVVFWCLGVCLCVRYMTMRTLWSVCVCVVVCCCLKKKQGKNGGRDQWNKSFLSLGGRGGVAFFSSSSSSSPPPGQSVCVVSRRRCGQKKNNLVVCEHSNLPLLVTPLIFIFFLHESKQRRDYKWALCSSILSLTLRRMMVYNNNMVVYVGVWSTTIITNTQPHSKQRDRLRWNNLNQILRTCKNKQTRGFWMQPQLTCEIVKTPEKNR